MPASDARFVFPDLCSRRGPSGRILLKICSVGLTLLEVGVARKNSFLVSVPKSGQLLFFGTIDIERFPVILSNFEFPVVRTYR